MMKNFKKSTSLAAVVLASMLLTGCGPDKAALTTEVEVALDKNFPAAFARFKFTEQPDSVDLQPARMFDGASSTVLSKTKAVNEAVFLGQDEVRIYGLAVTKKGTYFLFTYAAPLARDYWLPFFIDPCTQPDCGKFSAGSVSRKQAMRWFYESADFTPEKFKALFGEDAPPFFVEA